MIDIKNLALAFKIPLFNEKGWDMSDIRLPQLEAFAKAYLNEWLKEQAVVANVYGHDGTGGYDIEYYSELSIPIKLIALPSEVK